MEQNIPSGINIKVIECIKISRIFYREHDIDDGENRPGMKILMSLPVQAVQLYLGVLERNDRTSEKS